MPAIINKIIMYKMVYNALPQNGESALLLYSLPTTEKVNQWTGLAISHVNTVAKTLPNTPKIDEKILPKSGLILSRATFPPSLNNP